MLKFPLNKLALLLDPVLLKEVEYVEVLVEVAELFPFKEFENYLTKNPPSPRVIYLLMAKAQQKLHKEKKKQASALGKKAADDRHSQSGGSHDKRDKMRELWRIGKYSTKTECAEKECGKIGMSLSTAIKALQNQ